MRHAVTLAAVAFLAACGSEPPDVSEPIDPASEGEGEGEGEGEPAPLRHARVKVRGVGTPAPPCVSTCN